MNARGDSVAVGEGLPGGGGGTPVSDSISTMGVMMVALALLLCESVAVSVCVPFGVDNGRLTMMLKLPSPFVVGVPAAFPSNLTVTEELGVNPIPVRFTLSPGL